MQFRGHEGLKIDLEIIFSDLKSDQGFEKIRSIHDVNGYRDENLTSDSEVKPLTAIADICRAV